MLKENVQSNYGNASFPKFLREVQLMVEKQVLLGLLQLPSGHGCAAAGGHFSEILKIFSATNRTE